MMIVMVILMPTVESRSHWTIAMQVRRSPFRISENLSKLFTHLQIEMTKSPLCSKSPVKDLLSGLLGFLDEFQAGHAKLNGNFIVHFQCHKLVLL